MDNAYNKMDKWFLIVLYALYYNCSECICALYLLLDYIIQLKCTDY